MKLEEIANEASKLSEEERASLASRLLHGLESAVQVRFHRRVQADLDEILSKYDEISETLGDDFLAEFQIGISRVASNPRFFHFDSSGLRRCNLERFPYYFLCTTSRMKRSASGSSDMITAIPASA